MSEPFLGEIRLFALNYAPKGWALCNGQMLPINQNQALFSLLGTTYGGNGQTTFALPDLQGRAPVHFGGSMNLGESAGEAAHILTTQEMPAHTHLVSAASAAANAVSPEGRVWAAKENSYAPVDAPEYTMSPAALSSAGGSQPHSNMQPYQVLNFCIAMQGIYPSRD